VVVVLVDPCWQGGSAGGFGVVELLERPAVGEGAVEAFDLAVGLGPVGPDPLVGDAELGAGLAPEAGAVAGAVEFLRDVKRLRLA
jgi:hypothetical protein